MATPILPPTPQRLSRLRPLYRAAAHMTYAGGFLCTLSASLLMLSSACLAGLSGVTLAIGERLRERALCLLHLGHPAAAVALRARQVFYERRKQGVAMD
jgi:hypothetical protein